MLMLIGGLVVVLVAAFAVVVLFAIIMRLNTATCGNARDISAGL